MNVRLNGLGVMLSGLLALANIAGLVYLAMEALGVSQYLGTKSSFSVAEAAYLSALWTAVVAKACLGMLLNIAVFGWIILNIEMHDPRRDTFRHQVIDGIEALKPKDAAKQAA